MAIQSPSALMCIAVIALIPIMEAQVPSKVNLSDPLALPAHCGIDDNEPTSKLRQDLQADLANTVRTDAMHYFCIAERMKRLGNCQAENFYEKAILAAQDDPNYELYYADYLRNFRGAQTPLFPRAEEHYYRAQTKVSANPAPMVRSGEDTPSLIERGLIALYQRDGIPIAYRYAGSDSARRHIPVAFFATINRYQQAPADLDQEADIRDYTSEALLTQSRQSDVPLKVVQMRSLIRRKKAGETLDRLRFRYKAWPSFDLFFVHRQTNNDQVTTFTLTPQNPTFMFNELRQTDFAGSADKPFSLSRCFDIDLAAGFRFVQRWGLIEYQPGKHENIPQLDLQLKISRFVGPDKLNLETTFVYQWIQPAVPNYPNRYRSFFGATATYQIFRPLGVFHGSSYGNRFTERGWDFFAGFLRDNEAYLGVPPNPNNYPRRLDYFVGTSPRGLLWSRFDLTLRATRFTSDIVGISLQKNSQWRADATALIRVVDEDREKGIPAARQGTHLEFIHLTGGVRQDFAQTGPDAYENHKYGGGIDGAFYTTGSRTTFLLSANYDRERYFKLSRNSDAFRVVFSIGF